MGLKNNYQIALAIIWGMAPAILLLIFYLFFRVPVYEVTAIAVTLLGIFATYRLMSLDARNKNGEQRRIHILSRIHGIMIFFIFMAEWVLVTLYIYVTLELELNYQFSRTETILALLGLDLVDTPLTNEFIYFLVSVLFVWAVYGVAARIARATDGWSHRLFDDNNKTTN